MIPPSSTSEQLAALPLYDSIRGTIERFGIGDTKLRELGAAGLIETRKFGKKVLVSQASVLAYLQSLPKRAPMPRPMERADRGRFLPKKRARAKASA